MVRMEPEEVARLLRFPFWAVLKIQPRLSSCMVLYQTVVITVAYCCAPAAEQHREQVSDEFAAVGCTLQETSLRCAVVRQEAGSLAPSHSRNSPHPHRFG